MNTCEKYKTPDFKEIREMYEWFEPKLFEVYNRTKMAKRWTDPYCTGIDFMLTFTPIEFSTWHVLRGYGKAPFYPQYPVDKYFLDFGNPIVKVGIECDGEEFHTDKEKDFARDTELYNLGWTIYRISGVDCNRVVRLEEYADYDNNETDENIRDYYYHTIEGLVECLSARYFDNILWSSQNYDKARIISDVLTNRVSIRSQKFEDELSEFIYSYYNKISTL